MNTRPQAAPGGRPPGKDVAVAKPRIVELFGERYNVDPKEVVPVLLGTSFSVKRGDPPATREELIQLLVVADVYHLNPFTKEIYAFRNKSGGITPIVGIDGWVRIVESQPTFVGEEMLKGYDTDLGPKGIELGFYYECLVHRSDRKFPISRRQYYNENYRNTDPWNMMPTRMLQHRAYIQSARAAFGFGGIFDPDEGEVIAVSPGVDLLPARQPRTEAPRPKADEPPPTANVDQIELIKEQLAKTGLPDNLIFAKFEVGDFNEIPAERAADVLAFIKDNAP
jgi:phage recombination protein Bet